MKKRLFLLLLGILLSACGTSPSIPAGTSGDATPGLSMPLPDSEKTRIAIEAPTFPVPGTVSPTPTLQPVETQITPLPTVTPSDTVIETATPSFTVQPIETQITLIPSLTASEMVIGTAIPSPTFLLTSTIETSTPTSIAPIIATATPEPTRVEEASQPNDKSLLAALKFLIWPGGLCLAGFLILAIAITMFFFQRRRPQPVVHSLHLGDLDPEWGYVEVSGKVTQVPERLDDKVPFPLDNKHPAPVVVLRISIEEHDVETREWRPLRDDVRTTTFLLNDGTGTAWIDPQKQEVQLSGDGFVPSLEQVRAALQILRLPPQLVKGERLRYRIWILRTGDPVSVSGKVQTRPQVLVSPDERPLLLSPQNGHFQDTQTNKPPYTSFRVLAAIFGILGLCISGMGITLALSRLLP